MVLLQRSLVGSLNLYQVPYSHLYPSSRDSDTSDIYVHTQSHTPAHTHIHIRKTKINPGKTRPCWKEKLESVNVPLEAEAGKEMKLWLMLQFEFK